MERGYIKLWRSIDEGQQYHAEPFDKIHAWIDLLILSNYKDRTVNVRGIMVQVKRGQVLAGEEFLSSRWHWSRGKVRRHLEFLEKTVQQIEQQKNNVCSIITILNYDTYQTNDTADDTADGQQTDSRRTADGHTEESKEGKEGKEVVTKPPESLLFTDSEFLSLWDSWMESRKKMRVPNTDRAKELALRKLEAWGAPRAKEALRNAIEKGWRGVFEPPAAVFQNTAIQRDPEQQKILDRLNESARKAKCGY